MSRGVDVLAALRQIADGEGDTEVLAMRVHAAVAELIEAVDGGRNETFGRFIFDEHEANRLRAAIACVRGAS